MADTPPKSTAFPWPSTIALAFPAIVAGYLVYHRAPLMTVVGEVIANLGYTLVAAGVVSNSFAIFRLHGHLRIFAVAVACIVSGMVLSAI